MTTGLPPTISQSVTVTRHVLPSITSQQLAHRDQIDWHDHAGQQLVYARAGVLVASTDSGTWLLPPQRALWLPAEVPHAHQAHGATDMRTVSFARSEAGPAHGRAAVLAVSPLAREAIIALTENEGELTEREQRNIRRVILDQLRPLPDGPFYLPEPGDDRLLAINAMLHEDPADGRTLRQFGLVVGAAERTLSRLFRDQTGMTFPQYRAQVRLHHGLRRLASGMPVTAVAHECGYANASAFVEAFRLATGTTPGAYQRSIATA
jgi:AraC-like DNA-binding protein/quercetin dioxygenase-like cupin family protein